MNLSFVPVMAFAILAAVSGCKKQPRKITPGPDAGALVAEPLPVVVDAAVAVDERRIFVNVLAVGASLSPEAKLRAEDAVRSALSVEPEIGLEGPRGALPLYTVIVNVKVAKKGGAGKIELDVKVEIEARDADDTPFATAKANASAEGELKDAVLLEGDAVSSTVDELTDGQLRAAFRKKLASLVDARSSPGGLLPGVPAVMLGSGPKSGTLERTEILEAIRTRTGAVRACYEKALAQAPGLAGKVTARFVIAADGSMESIKATGMDDDVATCIEKVLSSVRFPPPKGGGKVTVNFPFVFQVAP